MSIIIFISLLLSFSQSATSQKSIKSRPTSKLLISALNSKVLYVDQATLVGIKTGTDSDTLNIKLSQGDFSVFDKNVFWIYPTKIGTLTISVFRQTDGKSILLGKKIFKVLLTPEQKTLNSLTLKPEISLCGYSRGKIPFDSIKKATSLTINNGYRIKSAMVYISGAHTGDTWTYALTSNLFDKTLLKAWSFLTPNSIITFDNIQIIDTKGRLYTIPSIGFTVTENKSN